MRFRGVACACAVLLALLLAALLPAGALAFISTGAGGWSWQNPLPQGNDLAAVSFIDAGRGWSVGDLGTILVTSDGGATWDAQRSGTTNHLNAVSFTDAAHGWAVGDLGTILVTSDGGATWGAQDSGVWQRLNGVTFTDSSHGWAVGGSGPS